jgi:hypothetical protein
MTDGLMLPQPRMALLPRVLGLYIAIAAGAIQIMDILVDRIGLDDRAFAFVIVLAALGIPIVSAGVLVFEAATADKRSPVRRVPPPAVRTPVQVDARKRDYADPPLQRQLEVALSYRRIAALQHEAGSADDAAKNHDAFIQEAEAVIDSLRAMIIDVTFPTGGR